jgi:nucleotidyltransferase/DNA polymerase involved in DNA repair
MEVACLYVPNFLVALARRDNASLRGKPVVVGGSPEEHAQVTACSEEAAEAGVNVGTTLRRALALCPKAVFLPLQESAAAAEAGRLTDLLCLYSPVVEVIAHGHAHFDVRGLARMAGMNDDAYLRDLHEAASATNGLPVRLAAAETIFAAHAGAVIPDSRFTIPDSSAVLVPDGATRTFLSHLPVEVLPVSPAMHVRLRLFGLERLGQLADLPFSAMQAQFGDEGAHAWQLARGRDDTVIVPGREELRIQDEMELPAPAAFTEPLIVGTRALLQRALNRPEIRGQTLRRLDWRLGLESGEQLTRRFVFREPTNDLARMLFVVKNKIERLQLTSAAVAIGVTLSGLCSEYGHQGKLWNTGPRRRRELLEAIDQLNARENETQVYRIVEVQPWSRIPERQLALVAYGA